MQRPGIRTSPYTPIWSVAVCATDVTDVSKDLYTGNGLHGVTL